MAMVHGSFSWPRESEACPVLIAALIMALSWRASSSSQATDSFEQIDVATASRSQ
jgi:hypothetical protein